MDAKLHCFVIGCDVADLLGLRPFIVVSANDMRDQALDWIAARQQPLFPSHNCMQRLGFILFKKGEVPRVERSEDTESNLTISTIRRFPEAQSLLLRLPGISVLRPVPHGGAECQ